MKLSAVDKILPLKDIANYMMKSIYAH